MTSEVIARLRFVLLEKLREAPAGNMELVRWYIREIRELGQPEEEAPYTIYPGVWP